MADKFIAQLNNADGLRIDTITKDTDDEGIERIKGDWLAILQIGDTIKIVSTVSYED